MNSRRHFLVLPWLAQGHVNPLMDFSRCIAKHGFKITFVNTQFIHNHIVSASSVLGGRIRLVSIPDGLGPEEDRNDITKLSKSMVRDMPSKLEEIIQNINEAASLDGNEGITCVVADPFMGWALEVADKMGIRRVVMAWIGHNFCLDIEYPILIEEGIIDGDGFPIKRKMIQLFPSMPAMDTSNFPWSCFGDLATQKAIFEDNVRNIQAVNIADWWLCNTTYELEPATFSLFPKLLPIGPLMASPQIENSGAQFWPEDSTCLNWLDQQPARTIIYVSFGSIAVLEETQFEELAWGLELSNRSFLWVVRPESMKGPTNTYPNGFQGSKGKIIGWAPQQKVLSHPAIACFLSHCGWNSTMEGLFNGVPFLCWPQFADQFSNKSYICDVWKVGLGFDMDENGIVSRKEVKKKVKQLLDDENMRARSLELMEMTINNIAEGGCSLKNLNNFLEWLKA